MKTRISLTRIGVALVASLVVLGLILLTFTGSLWDGLAAAGGFTHARFDLLLGKRELHLSAHWHGGGGSIPRIWFTGAGYQYTLKYFQCVGSTPCFAYHDTYDVQVRNAINRDFGYDIFAEYAAVRAGNLTLMVKHE